MNSDGGSKKQTGYRLEYASSSRAKCSGPKPCSGTTISKGELRLGTLLDYNGNKSFKWRHWGCTTTRILSNFKNQFDTVDEIDGFDELREEDQDRVRNAWIEGHVAEEDIPTTARKDASEVDVTNSNNKTTKRRRKGAEVTGESAESKQSTVGQAPTNDSTNRAASLSHAAECLARAAAKLSEAARAMSLVAEALSRGNPARHSDIDGSMGKPIVLHLDDSTSSSDAIVNEEEGVDLPQPYSLLLDEEEDVLLVLCALIYDHPKVVCYFTGGDRALKLYKSLIDGVAATDAIIADPYDESSIDHCYSKFLKEKRSILLLLEIDIPSTPAKELTEYTLVHVGWPVSRRQYIAQRRAHHASTNLLLAYSGDKDLYSSGSAIMSQTTAWPGDTGGFRASVDIFRPLFEERLSELSFEMKEELYLDWIHLHSSQGPRSVSSWTPSAIVSRANKFILGPLAYRSPGSLTQGSSLQTSLAELLPEVSAEFVAQHGLQAAVNEGLLRVEAEVNIDDTHEPNFNSAPLLSLESTRPRRVSGAPSSYSQYQGVTETNNIQGQHTLVPPFNRTNTAPGVSRIPSNFKLATGQTYFALDEEFDSIPLIYFLTNKFKKTIIFLEGEMLKRYKNLFHRLIRLEVLTIANTQTAGAVSLQFVKCTSPAVLLIQHTINELPSVLREFAIGCWIYWVHDLQVQTAKQFQAQIKCNLASLIIPSSRRDRLVEETSDFKEHPQSSLILARGQQSLLEPERNATRSMLMSEGTNVRGLYSKYICSLRGVHGQGRSSAQDIARLANLFAARVLLHGSQQDGSKVFPPIGGRPSVTPDLVKIFRLQPAVNAGLLHVN